MLLIVGIFMVACVRNQKPHQLSQRNGHEKFENERVEFDDPKGAAEWEFKMLKDQTGKIPAHIRQREKDQARAIYAKHLRDGSQTSNLYTIQGPSNVGGRTRCVAFDLRYNNVDNRTLIAGGVSGGIYKSTDGGNTWMRKGALTEIYTVTSIVQDPRPGHQDTWYYGTGEGMGTDDNYQVPRFMGDGVYKSIDNGETWTRLVNSNTGVLEEQDRNEDLIFRLAVHPLNGHVYMSVMNALYRSVDEGNSWSVVLGPASMNAGPFLFSDIIITSNGNLYAAFSGYGGSELDGVWTSQNGDPNTWTRIAGEGSGGDPVGWENEDNYGRVILASPSSSPNLVYAFVQAFSNNCPSFLSRARLFKWDQSDASWTNLSNNLPGCAGGMDALQLQGGYNMTLAIKPDDPNIIFIGGTNLYRSTDGFTTQINITQIGGYNNWNLHPDMHWIAFNPADLLNMICGNDGGIQMTYNDLAPYVIWFTRNNNYLTTQFYFAAIDPRRGSNTIIGGLQDNGTYRSTGGGANVFEWVNGGDGMSVGISEEINGIVYEYTSTQIGVMYRRNANSPPLSGHTNITPATMSYPTSFFTLFKLDEDNTEKLYYVNSNRLFRTSNASTVNMDTWTEMTGVASLRCPFGAPPLITALATTRGSYIDSKSSLFYGTDCGKVFRIDDPANISPTTIPSHITGTNFPEWGFISSVSVNPRNDDTVVVTFSNYSTNSIWWTGNANSASPTWISIERNLTLPSIRSSVIAVTASGVEYFVGTSVGLFHTSNPLANDWNQEGPNDIGNAMVSVLALRNSDNRLLVGTYGNGLWTTSLSSPAMPVKLVNLTGNLQNGYATLRWSTATEYGTDRFEVQRSTDGINYETAGIVSAVGNSNTLHYYQFTDPRTPSNKNFYRLKIIDKDSRYELSHVVLIRKDATIQDIVVENPFYDHINLQLAKMPGNKVVASLFDMNGKLVGREEFSNKTHMVLRFNNSLALLKKGIYLLQVKDGNTVLERKLLRQ